jgi:hypothetical protein
MKAETTRYWGIRRVRLRSRRVATANFGETSSASAPCAPARPRRSHGDGGPEPWRRRACLAIAAQLRRRAFTTAVAVMIGGGSSVLACPVCFGAEETSMVDGTKIGVLVMLAITLAVQGGFVGFFLYLRRRAKRIADVELDTEWSELQGVPRTS